EVIRERREQKSQSGRYARAGRDQHLRNLQAARQLNGMKRPCPSKTHHRDAMNIATTFGNGCFERIGHRLVDDFMDPPCRLERIDPKRLGDVLLQRLLRSRYIELHSATGKIIGIEEAKDQIGIGDGGQLATPAIARGTWRCPSARWA